MPPVPAPVVAPPPAPLCELEATEPPGPPELLCAADVDVVECPPVPLEVNSNVG